MYEAATGAHRFIRLPAVRLIANPVFKLAPHALRKESVEAFWVHQPGNHFPLWIVQRVIVLLINIHGSPLSSSH